MNPVLRFVFFVLAALGMLAVLPLGIDFGLAWRDERFDPYTRPQSIRMEADTLFEGGNRRLFQDVRFPTTGLSFQVTATGLTAAERQAVLDGAPVCGEVSLFALPSATNAVPGEGPAEGARKILSYEFRLEPLPSESFAEESVEAFFEKGKATRSLTFVLRPRAKADEAPAAALEAFRFEKTDAYEIDFRLDGRLPVTNKLLFLYRKPVRRLFVRRGARS